MGKTELTEEHRQIAVHIRHRIVALERTMHEEIDAGRMVELDGSAPLQHHFAPGAYARTIELPTGALVVGKIHKHAHLNVLSKGDVLVLTEGGGLERLTGPLTMVSPPGTKRAVYVLADAVWTTMHLTNETDLEKIEEHVIAKDFEEYEQFLKLEGKNMKQLEVQS